ncbi:MAG: M13 family metallopeptidase [Chitinophagales bacterium]|nr:M13 family metallopeptidase [Chitinophagales bacterium]
MKTSFLLFAVLLLTLSWTAPLKAQHGSQRTNPIDVTTFDSTFNPKNNFYDFVNARWIKQNPIPSTESSWRMLEVVDDSVRYKLKKVLESAAAAQAQKDGSSTQKVGDFYLTGMDSAAINKAGITPLKPYLDTIAAFKNKDDVIRFTAHSNLINSTALLASYVDQDQMNSKKYVLYLYQTGLGLPDRDYYFLNDEKSKQIRDEYIKHIIRYFALLGDDSIKAKSHAQEIMKMETGLAKSSMTRVEQRDPYATYNKMTKADLKKKYSAVNWDLYFSSLKLKSFDTLIVSQPKFFALVDSMLKSTPIDSWKIYYRFHLINGAASVLSSDFATEDFKFYSGTLRGIEEMDPRWKRIQELENSCLGELVGQEFVKTNFTPQSKQRMLELIHNLMEAYSERIAGVDWMTDSTKAYAQKKLSQLMIKVGYPDKWRDYSVVKIDRKSFVLNVINCFQFENRRNLNKLGTEVDRTEWLMTPQTVNAYYNPVNNEIVFPAAILQPPFFYPDADDAMNYGAIGAVIGHEITHGFDDQGRQYDAEGNLKEWWTPQDAKNYNQRTKLITEQYNTYSPIDTFHLNGELTQGENIADLGGLTIAYYAFRKAKAENPNDTATVAGLTADQRFFISFAKVWAGTFRPEEQKRRLVVDPHSPGKYRVIGVLSNMPEFYKAFNVKPGDQMYREESVRGKVW